MRRISRAMKLFSLTAAGTMMAGFGGGCLTDNFWADKSAEIANGLIISALNLILVPTGLAI